ncbi:copper chaperone PCu(A)C [Roseibium aggregatum]|uniref:copper chaperone PCu(A)C n=1 Tax=Roseibium aggregatum TaxID=187304 RepID=UPI003A96DEFB
MDTWILARKRASAFAAALALCSLGLAPSFAEESQGHMQAEAVGIVVSDAMSPAVAPGIKTAAVYFTLANNSGSDADLVAVQSPAFAIAHFHKTAMADGLMTMEPVAQLSIPQGESVSFAPGSLHVMLMGAKKRLEAGDRFMLTLQFGTGTTLEVPVDVVKPGDFSGGSHDHSSMKMN